MKRILALSIALLLLLTACGQEPAEQTTSSPSPLDELPTMTVAPTPTQEPEPQVGNNPLTGLQVEEEFEQNRPIAVMLNNLKKALPMYGTSTADILVEALAEGGITRLVGIWQNATQVPKIGSVRSTRAYYLDVAAGFDAILLHAGGSPEAYSLISQRGMTAWDCVNGPYEGSLFYRDSERKKNAGYEHSVFTTGERITEQLEKNKARLTHEEGYDNGLRFAPDATPENGETAEKLTLPYSSYKTGVFTYNPEDKLYYVEEYDKPFADGENDEQVAVTNVIVMETAVSLIKGDSSGRLRTEMTGTGSGIYACGGKYVPIKWSRDNWDSTFNFTLEDGTPLTLSCGKTYINIFPKNTEYTVE